MKIGLLTSSRADFGIYTPLLEALHEEANVTIELIAFGTHLSPYHGYTLVELEHWSGIPIRKVYGMPLEDHPASVASAFGTLLSNFAQFWGEHTYDWVLCLGDRYEMCAAVQAGIPFQVKFAHLHGGETTLGAIDNIYRHQITLASAMHFTATQAYRQRVLSILGHDENVHCTGAINIEKLNDEVIPAWAETKSKFGIDVDEFVLCTFHPETIQPERNKEFAHLTADVLSKLSYSIPIVITLPNADSYGSLYRSVFTKLASATANEIILIENFGRKHYFSALTQARFVLGNSSSAIIEAASFSKMVINVGDRQKGRMRSENVIDLPFDYQKILSNCQTLLTGESYKGSNVYLKQGGIAEIVKCLLNE